MSRSHDTLIALRRILRATEQHGRAVARDSGLTPVQLRVLGVLDQGHRVTPKSVAQQLGVSQATVSALLDRLEAKGLVLRQRSHGDRRQTDLILTDAGRARLSAAPDPLQDQFVNRFERLPEWEQAMIVAAVERVAHLLDAAGIDAAPVLDAGDLGRPASRQS